MRLSRRCKMDSSHYQRSTVDRSLLLTILILLSCSAIMLPLFKRLDLWSQHEKSLTELMQSYKERAQKRVVHSMTIWTRPEAKRRFGYDRGFLGENKKKPTNVV